MGKFIVSWSRFFNYRLISISILDLEPVTMPCSYHPYQLHSTAHSHINVIITKSLHQMPQLTTQQNVYNVYFAHLFQLQYWQVIGD